MVRNVRNLGPGGARNHAIEESSGELIAILDADDRWSPEYLASQVSLFDRSNTAGDVGIVACDARLVDEAGELLGTYSERFSFPEQLTLARLLAGNQIFISALVPRHVVEEVDGFASYAHQAEDWDLWIRILERGYRLVRNPEVLVTYRKSGDSLSADRAKVAQAMLAVYRKALERGNLDWRERWVARRGIRTERLVSDLADYRRQRAQGARPPAGRALRIVGLAGTVAVQSPRRWRWGLRRLTRS